MEFIVRHNINHHYGQTNHQHEVSGNHRHGLGRMNYEKWNY